MAGYGLGVNDWEVCAEALSHCDLDVLLLARCTLADQSALPQLLTLCVQRDVRVVIGGPFNSGILASGACPADGSAPHFNYQLASKSVVAHVASIEKVCQAHRVPLKAAALQFPLAHAAVASVIPDARSVREFDENLRLLAYPIPPAFWSDSRTEALLPKIPG